MPQISSRQLVKHKENGLGVIEYSEVVAALNKKCLQKNECSLLRNKVLKLESMWLLMGQQM